MKSLIVGSEGQDGLQLTNILNQQNYLYCSITKNGFFFQGVKYLEYKEINTITLMKLLIDLNISTIYFFAAYSIPENSRKFVDSNFEETQHKKVEQLLATCVEASKLCSQVNNFVYTSSSQRFGAMAGIVSENTDVRPVNQYAVHKLRCESIVTSGFQKSESTRIIIPILFNHTSWKPNSNFLLPLVLQKALAKDQLFFDKQFEDQGRLLHSLDIGYSAQFVKLIHDLTISTDFEGFINIATGKSFPVWFYIVGFLEQIYTSYENTNMHFNTSPPQFQVQLTKLVSMLKLDLNELYSGLTLIKKLIHDSQGIE